eukprot:3159088-Pleurochrysis_carterae.AAC.1
MILYPSWRPTATYYWFCVQAHSQKWSRRTGEHRQRHGCHKSTRPTYLNHAFRQNLSTEGMNIVHHNANALHARVPCACRSMRKLMYGISPGPEAVAEKRPYANKLCALAYRQCTLKGCGAPEADQAVADFRLGRVHDSAPLRPFSLRVGAGHVSVRWLVG